MLLLLLINTVMFLYFILFFFLFEKKIRILDEENDGKPSESGSNTEGNRNC